MYQNITYYNSITQKFIILNATVLYCKMYYTRIDCYLLENIYGHSEMTTFKLLVVIFASFVLPCNVLCYAWFDFRFAGVFNLLHGFCELRVES